MFVWPLCWSFWDKSSKKPAKLKCLKERNREDPNSASSGDITWAKIVGTIFIFFDNCECRLFIKMKPFLVRMETASWTTMSSSRWCCSIETLFTGTPSMNQIWNSIKFLLVSSYQGWNLGWSQVQISLLLLHMFNKVSLQCLLVLIWEIFIGLCLY